jgi:hypothetical protein
MLPLFLKSSASIWNSFATAGMSFIYFMVGVFSMWLIALDWNDKISSIGVLGAGSGGFMLGLWLM